MAVKNVDVNHGRHGREWPKVGNICQRLTCKWPAPLCIKIEKQITKSGDSTYVNVTGLHHSWLASYWHWLAGNSSPGDSNSISIQFGLLSSNQSVKPASPSLRMRTNANVSVVTSCRTDRSSIRPSIHRSIDCNASAMENCVCSAHLIDD